MKSRCNNPNDGQYKHYGERGISYCDEWESFIVFYKDMGPCPPKHSIDRINNNKGYYPENCKWATQSEQASNRRKTLVVKVGEVYMSLPEYSKYTGLSYSRLQYLSYSKQLETFHLGDIENPKRL